MKEPEEYLEEFDFFEEDNECGVFSYLIDNAEKGELVRVIKQAQIDAWNEAIDEAANKAETIYVEEDGCATGDYYDIDKDSILKLKK